FHDSGPAAAAEARGLDAICTACDPYTASAADAGDARRRPSPPGPIQGAHMSRQQNDHRRVALALMAHPDDAEILCGGTLIRLSQLGWQVHIATATAGDCGTTDQSPWAISATRTEEAKQAAALIGAQYHCLGLLDVQVIFDRV